MIAYIQGKITACHPTFVVVECNGIGYHVNISLHTHSKIEKQEHCKLFTYLNFKHEAQSLAAVELFGFAEEEERVLFTQLISVSGISSATARVILSSFSPGEIRMAILQEDVGLIKSVKGIGPKLAKRMILELKDKIAKAPVEEEAVNVSTNNMVKQEALEALVTLGFQKPLAEKAVRAALKANQDVTSVEELIKVSLKTL